MAVVKSKFTPQTDLFLYQVIFKRICTSCCLHRLVQTGTCTAAALVPMSLLDAPRGSCSTMLLHAMGKVMEFLWQEGSLGLTAQMAGLSFWEYVTTQVGWWNYKYMASQLWCGAGRPGHPQSQPPHGLHTGQCLQPKPMQLSPQSRKQHQLNRRAAANNSKW